ncbi:RNA polymerase-associated protein CTR9-like protein [Platysternon megacephalum]|uniref:RNA polymerase-associated protein CTR9-like protein n=1 Tax=Platysternon megacephalum TaxID=55544 RepID=A0A4D9E029_9SAUR|nr:RNA polymerase-associated protein CTR9-like protein [Platysternon megacephalum]
MIEPGKTGAGIRSQVITSFKLAVPMERRIIAKASRTRSDVPKGSEEKLKLDIQNGFVPAGRWSGLPEEMADASLLQSSKGTLGRKIVERGDCQIPGSGCTERPANAGVHSPMCGVDLPSHSWKTQEG